MPDEWKESIIVPIHKKEDKTDCNNYRGILLLPTTYKILSNILLSRGVHRVLVGKPEGKRPLGKPRRRLEDNIKMDLQEREGVVGTGWSWLRRGTGGGRLWVR